MGSCCTCFHGALKTPLRVLIISLQVAVSVAAVLIIYFQLTDFEWSVEASWRVVTVTNVQCLLGTSNGSSLCHLGYAVCGISLAAALAMAAVLCCRHEACFYIAPWLELVLSVAAALLWAAAALVLTDADARANSAGLPRADWRNAVCTLSWVNALLFSVLACIACCSVCFDVLGCCGGKAAAEQRRARARELADAKRASKERRSAEAAAAKAAKAGTMPVQGSPGQEPTQGAGLAAAGAANDDKLGAQV